ncbi:MULTISPECIES: PKD domain-containing protein [Mumia]|uniref:PKD domain-containing protein n=2 Tax=Mumia TaxID=1546255 RepID=A0ABW1QH73_9ACTN|nr:MULTISPECIES: PKD domain-containing protein [Mumia]
MSTARPLRQAVRRITGVMTATLVVAAAITASALPAAADSAPADPTDPRTPTTVTADALPTVQVDGVVWSQAVVGGAVYAGGSFSSARPAGAAAGTGETPRGNLLRYNLSTGVLDSTFSPSFNAQVRTVAVSPDKSRVYVGGDFTAVDGTTRNRIAAFDATTGALVAGFAPPVNYHVYSIVATDDVVYAAGNFLGVGTQSRGNLAAFDAQTGALLAWAPVAAGGLVTSIVLSPDGTTVVAGGSFTTMNGSSDPGYGLAAVDASTGALKPWLSNSVVRNGGTEASITSLSADDQNVYGTGYVFGSGGNVEGTFAARWSDGALQWINDCHGDTYAAHPQDGVVYTAGHAHYCGNVDGFPQTEPNWSFYRAIAFGKQATGTVTNDPYGYANFAGQPRSELLAWFPTMNAGTYTGQNQGPWSVTGSGDYVLMGGEFTRVNYTGQQGLVRYAKRAVAPRTRGPQLFSTTYPINVVSTEPGAVRINWKANQDDDNDSLTYRVYRDDQNGSGLIHQRVARARWWNRTTMGFTDRGLAPGSTHRYRVAVTDPDGNIANSPWVDVTVSAAGTPSAYLNAVHASEPEYYWRLGESSGSNAADTLGQGNVALNGTYSRGGTGALSGDSDKSVTFGNILFNGAASTQVAETPPNVFTLETWVKTTTGSGGKLLGFGDKMTGASSNYDRHVYLDSSGRVHFGVYPGSAAVVSSTGKVNNGQWHHVVASLGPDGMKLYIDGSKVASRTDVKNGQNGFWGYWRLGGDNLASWPNASSSSGNFKGSLDEVAIYKSVLSDADVAAHYQAGKTGQGQNAAPTAAMTTSTQDLTVSVNGSTSFDVDGSIASHAWDFGDGATATGATATHTYADSGTYDVTLTVTDGGGATDVLTRQVTVTAPPPNQAPTAAFSTTKNDLSVSVNAGASSDPDGSIASYAWNFGDGATATGATASHGYTTPGTYDITLTVTDDDGATGSVTHQVTVSGPPVPFAVDTFARTVVDGWGSAETGGAWTRTGSATNFSVAAGTGRIRMGSAGAGPSIALNGVSSTSSDLTLSASLDKVATGGGIYITASARSIAGVGGYGLKTRFLADGSLSAALTRTEGGTETAIATGAVAGSHAAGDTWRIRVQATGTAPTTIRAKIWRAGTSEPGSWLVTATDSTAALQAAGGIAFNPYLSGSATNAPIIASFDEVNAVALP